MSSVTPKKTYKVLWFDDEHESLEGIWREARDADIDLDGVSSAEEGIRILENNYDAYDAVLVDGLFHSKKGMSGRGYNPVAAGDVGRKLSALEVNKGHIPTFLLSGQPDFRDNVNGIIQTLGYDRFYDKNENLDELWKNLKKAADDQPNTQIRHRYQRVFEVCTKQYIGETSATDLLDMLKLLDTSGNYRETKKFFGAIRQIMEDLFIACNRIGLVPNAFMPASAALNETGRFLGGQREVRGYGLEPDVVPRVVGDLIDAILKMTQPGSHRAGVDAHLAIVQSSYLLQGVAYMLMDVLLWFRDFVDAPPAKPLYRVASTTECVYTGLIELDGEGNFHCGEHGITPIQMGTNGCKQGDTVCITSTAENTNQRTRKLYPRFAKRFHKVEPPTSYELRTTD